MWATEGAVLVAGDTGGKLVVYDVEMEFEEMDMPIDAFASINDIAIALSYPDDDDYYGELDYVLVGTDSGLAIYDSNGDFMQLMLAHGGSGTRAVKMSPDGDLMATAGEVGTDTRGL